MKCVRVLVGAFYKVLYNTANMSAAHTVDLILTALQ